MSFFERNRKQLAEMGIDPARLPPGQYHTERFPVLHVGAVPTYDLETWTLRVFGLVEREVTLSWDELRALPATEIVTDIHCVTKWSKFDTPWRGVRLRDLYELAGLSGDAQHVVMHAEYGYTANVPLADTLGDDCLLAYEYDGQPLAPEHGFPARTLIPHLYFWKSVKWVRAIELVAGDRPGFWEQNGYHNYGDPFREQRHWGDEERSDPASEERSDPASEERSDPASEERSDPASTVRRPGTVPDAETGQRGMSANG